MECKPLKEVAQIIMGQSPDSSSYNEVGEGLPFFQGNADFGVMYPSERIWCNQPKKIANENDILISVRAPIGALNYANKKCCIGRGLAAITVKNPVERNYIFHLLKAKNAELNRQGTGSTFKAIGKNVLEDILVPIVSSETQLHITRLMDITESIISKRKKELKYYDELIKARFVEMFGNRWSNNKHWPVKTLGESTEFFNGKAHEQVVDDNGEYILVTSRCIASNLSDYRRTNTLLFPLRTGDICMVMSDVPNGKALAKCFLIDKDNLYTLNQRICCFRNYSLNKTFFLHLLNRHEYLLSFNDGDSQTNLRKGDLLNCPIINPPITLQEEFETFVKQIDKSKFSKIA